MAYYSISNVLVEFLNKKIFDYYWNPINIKIEFPFLDLKALLSFLVQITSLKTFLHEFTIMVIEFTFE